MVEADRPRAGDAPVCASSAQCLAHARWPCDTFEHVGCGAADGWRCLGQASRPAVSSVSLLLSCDSAFRRETRTELAMPTPSSIRPQPVRRDARSPITSCGCSPSIRSGGRCFRSQCVSARKRSQTCARTISSCFPSDRDPPAMKLSSAAATLQLAGYKPARVVGERHLDAAQAQRMSCPDCGAHGLRYNSYEHPSGSSHRGLAWCPECLTTVEL